MYSYASCRGNGRQNRGLLKGDQITITEMSPRITAIHQGSLEPLIPLALWFRKANYLEFMGWKEQKELNHRKALSASPGFRTEGCFQNGTVDEGPRLWEVLPFLVTFSGLNPFCDPDEPRIPEFLSCSFLLFIIV